MAHFQQPSKTNCYYIIRKCHIHINKQNIICYIKYATLLYIITLKTRLTCQKKNDFTLSPYSYIRTLK